MSGEPPRRLGDYELAGEIARGGMGVVYRARHVLLDREVALKVIVAGKDAPAGLVERFHREARAAARLHHPGIVAIHDMGSEGGLDYFTMDLVEGRSLAAILDDDGFELGSGFAWMREVCDAVHYAHIHGVFHRDLKPGNILIAADGRALVTDFGLARDVRQDQMTRSGDVLGTPSYMAPEQVGAEGGRIDARTDVYALGVILYQMASGGALPYEADTPIEILYKLRNEPPAPLAVCNRDLDRDVTTIVGKAMAKARSDRYATVRQLGDDLGAYLAGEPISARPLSRWERSRRFYRSHRLVVNLTVLVIALLTGLLVHIIAQGRERDKALRFFTQAAATEVLRGLREEAETDLWPPWPEKIERMQDWLRRVRSELKPTRMRSECKKMLSQLQAGERFGLEHTSADWLKRVLVRLQVDLDVFLHRDRFKGLLASVRQRLEWARTIRRRSIDEHRHRWRQAIASISDRRECLKYRGWPWKPLAPQMGLAPIGRNPVSGLWEFLHLRTSRRGKARIPSRRSDGTLAINESHGLVFVLIPGVH